jgi:hypothetical protein
VRARASLTRRRSKLVGPAPLLPPRVEAMESALFIFGAVLLVLGVLTVFF